MARVAHRAGMGGIVTPVLVGSPVRRSRRSEAAISRRVLANRGSLLWGGSGGDGLLSLDPCGASSVPSALGSRARGVYSTGGYRLPPPRRMSPRLPVFRGSWPGEGRGDPGAGERGDRAGELGDLRGEPKVRIRLEAGDPGRGEAGVEAPVSNCE